MPFSPHFGGEKYWHLVQAQTRQRKVDNLAFEEYMIMGLGFRYDFKKNDLKWVFSKKILMSAYSSFDLG